MFTIEDIVDKDLKKILLTETGSGTSVEILPDCGGILHSFSITHNGRKVNVIEQYKDEQDFAANVEASGFKSCKLSPFACRINKGAYRFAGNRYTIEKFYLGPHALHGLLYDEVFTVTDRQADTENATVTLQYNYKGSDKGYPFYFDCITRYELGKLNSLKLTTTIINRTEGLIPMQDGWHPYFNLGGKIDELQLEFQSLSILEFDPELIPTGKLLPYQEFDSLKQLGDTVLDNCFVLNFAECQPLCVLRDPRAKLQLEIYPERSYPYLQLYTPPHRNSIAIENLSAAPDAFNNGMGLITMNPGESIDFTTTYTITSLL